MVTMDNITAANACIEKLEIANECILQDSEKCGCFGNDFLVRFPNQVEAEFTRGLSKKDPTNPEFCDDLSETTCDFLQKSASCCCHQRTAEFAACFYAEELVPKYEVFEMGNCTSNDIISSSCRIEVTPEEMDAKSMIILGIIGSLIAFVVSICCCYFVRRKKSTKHSHKKNGIHVNLNLTSGGTVTREVRTETHHQNVRQNSGRRRPVSFAFPFHL